MFEAATNVALKIVIRRHVTRISILLCNNIALKIAVKNRSVQVTSPLNIGQCYIIFSVFNLAFEMTKSPPNFFQLVTTSSSLMSPSCMRSIVITDLKLRLQSAINLAGFTWEVREAPEKLIKHLAIASWFTRISFCLTSLSRKRHACATGKVSNAGRCLFSYLCD